MLQLPPTETLQAWLPLLRAGLFLSCLGYWLILRAWLKPDADAQRRAALAALAQFWVGLLADIFIQRGGAWQYRPMPFSLAGVPIDLHLDWALIWGFGLVWLGDKVLGPRPSTRRIAGYLLAWTAMTLAFDAVMAASTLFIASASPTWWLTDIAFLAIVQGFTLWFYSSVDHDGERHCGLAGLPPLRPWLRSLVYLSLGLPLFYVYLPRLAETQAQRFGLGSAAMEGPWTPSMLLAPAGLPLALVLIGSAWGGWAVLSFIRAGGGSPLPLDPPRRLVRTGPYAWTANPMQQSGLLLLLALLLARPSWVMAAYALDILITVLVVFLIFESPTLASRFPSEYSSFVARVRPWRFRRPAA